MVSEMSPEEPVQGPDPYLEIHRALDRSRASGDLGEDWYMTDFLVVGVAESFKPEHKGMSLSFYVGPEGDLPPHRILGLLDYTRARYKHTITCCRCMEIDEDE